MTTITISTKGWVVIPASLRKKYQLKPGTQVNIIDYGGVLSIVPLGKDPVEAGAGMLAGGSSLTEALLAERREESSREDRLEL